MNRCLWLGAVLAGGLLGVLGGAKGPGGESAPAGKPPALLQPPPPPAEKLVLPAPTSPSEPPLVQNSRNAEKAILKALAEKSEADFVETPLKEVLAFWQQRHRIAIALDPNALEAIGITPELPITLHRKEASFRAILEQMLEPLGLAWTIRHESLWITTPDQLQEYLVSRVYAVEDLLPGRSEQLQNELEDLIQVITSTVRPQSWSDVGGPGCVMPVIVQGKGCLVIHQSWPVHLEIMQLLEELREVVRHRGTNSSKPPSPSP